MPDQNHLGLIPGRLIHQHPKTGGEDPVRAPLESRLQGEQPVPLRPRGQGDDERYGALGLAVGGVKRGESLFERPIQRGNGVVGRAFERNVAVVSHGVGGLHQHLASLDTPLSLHRIRALDFLSNVGRILG